MSYGVTPKGFIGKPFNATLDSMVERSKTKFGEQLPTAPETVAGQFLNIIAAEITDAWGLGEDVAAMQNRSWAEGVYLDYLARITGLSRLRESGSTGNLLFTGDVGTTIQPFTACKDSLNRNVLTDVSLTLNRASCYSSSFTIETLVDDTDYTLNVEGTAFTVDSGTGATNISVLQALEVSINLANVVTVVVDVDEETITLSNPTFNNNLTTTNSDNITLHQVGSIVTGTSANVGSTVNFSAESINTLVTSNLGINSVTNPTSFQNGRNEESDAELRLRMDSKEESAGTATKPSIEASLSEIEGVVSALVVRNNTLVDDPLTGIPRKHAEVFVRGGNDVSIAEVLWKTFPLFGNFHGDVVQTITDENGVEQDIRFSRPISSFAHVRVVYAIDPEGTFPADGEDGMRNAVADYGNKQPEGTDLVPSKFYGALYTVEGVLINNIQVAVTANENDLPTFQSASIPVGAVDSLIFHTDRVIITT